MKEFEVTSDFTSAKDSSKLDAMVELVDIKALMEARLSGVSEVTAVRHTQNLGRFFGFKVKFVFEKDFREEHSSCPT